MGSASQQCQLLQSSRGQKQKDGLFSLDLTLPGSSLKDLLSDACKDAFGKHKDGERVDVAEAILTGPSTSSPCGLIRSSKEVKDGFKTQIIDNAYTGASGIPHDVMLLLRIIMR
eukprot:6472253-Amphidinium_carterae.1